MLTQPIRRGDRVVVSAKYSKYRGQKGEVLDFTPSQKSVRVQLANDVATVRVTSVSRIGKEGPAVEEVLDALVAEVKALRRVVRLCLKQSQGIPRS